MRNILAKIKDKQPYINLEIKEGDPTSRTKLGMVAQAKLEVEALKRDYRDAVLRSMVILVATGPRALSAKDILVTEFGMNDGSPSTLTKKISSKIDTSLYLNKTMHNSAIDVASNIMDGLAKEMDIWSYPAFYYDSRKHNIHLNSEEDLQTILEDILLESVGGEVFAIHAGNNIYSSLLDASFEGPVVPVVMVVREEKAAKLIADLNKVTRNVFHINTDPKKKIGDFSITSKKLDNESLEKILTQIKQSLT
jgi:hypothetical protein